MKNIIILIIVIVVAVITFQHKKQQGLNTAMLTQGFDAAGRLRMTSEMYFDGMGELPSSNSQLGVATPEYYANQSLRTATILTDGVIELVYEGNTGIDGGTIRFVPTIAPGMIKWSCETHDYEDIADYFLCKYTPR